MRVQYFHTRCPHERLELVDTAQLTEYVPPYQGRPGRANMNRAGVRVVTACKIVLDGRVSYGLAFCTQNFCRRVGRGIAYQRARSNRPMSPGLALAVEYMFERRGAR